MQAADHEVLRQALAWLDAGESCWFATVVATWGSSPRPVGSLFTCNARGQLAGSLSGGCVEDDLVEKLLAGEIAHDAPEYYRYGVTAEETERLGLPCGGYLDIVVEPLLAERDTEQFTAIVERDGPWYVAYCAEVPGANGQGKSREECLTNLKEAIALILEHRREESLRSLPPDAGKELVVVG